MSLASLAGGALSSLGFGLAAPAATGSGGPDLYAIAALVSSVAGLVVAISGVIRKRRDDDDE